MRAGIFWEARRGEGGPRAGKRLLAGSQPLAGLDPPPGVWGGVRLQKSPAPPPKAIVGLGGYVEVRVTTADSGSPRLRVEGRVGCLVRRGRRGGGLRKGLQQRPAAGTCPLMGSRGPQWRLKLGLGSQRQVATLESRDKYQLRNKGN